MKVKTLLIALLLTLMAPSLASGSNDWIQLKGAELRDAYIGQTLDLVYNSVGFTNTPHHTETHHADGRTDYTEGKLKLDGQWQLVGAPGFEDQICYRYPQLDTERKHCFFIFREGNCLYYYPSRWFRSVNNIAREQWRAKGANREDGPSCDIFVS